MEPQKMLQQMINFNKYMFENTFNSITMFQEQMERMSNMFLDQATGMPEEGKKAVTEWVKSYKTARDDFKKVVEDNFKKMEEFCAADKFK
ncbi:MAG: hypothetical protein HQK58_08065 [Deltaproteobacteria bacterium]|nr:hypothetical protein [Deltaproteobacteria bacterium]